MKTKITILSRSFGKGLLLTLAALMCTAFTTISAQIDLVPGINYSYNPPGSNGIITSITVDACNNDNGNAGSFKVAMYLYEQSSGNYWIIGTTTLPGLSGSACITISNWDIDINSTPGIPQGTYRLGVWVDSDDDISETDESNNAGLLSGNINYIPSTSAVIDFSQIGEMPEWESPSPNPTAGITNFSFSIFDNSNVELTVFDVSGKKVATLVSEKLLAGTYTYEMDAALLQTGIYFCTLNAGGYAATQKLVVTR